MEPSKHGSKQLDKSKRPQQRRKATLDDNSIVRAISTFTRLSSYQALLPKKYPNTVIASIGELLHGFAGIDIEPSKDNTKTWKITFLHTGQDGEPQYQWRKVNQQLMSNSQVTNPKYCVALQNHIDEHATAILGCVTNYKVTDPPTSITTRAFYLYFSTGFTIHYSGVVTNEDGDEFYNFIINNQHKSPGFFRKVGPLRIVGHGGTLNHTKYLTTEKNVYKSNMSPYSINTFKELLDVVEDKGNTLFHLNLHSHASAPKEKSNNKQPSKSTVKPKDKSTMRNFDQREKQVDKTRYSADPKSTTTTASSKMSSADLRPAGEDVVIRKAKSKPPKKNMTIDEYKQLLAEGKIKVKKH